MPPLLSQSTAAASSIFGPSTCCCIKAALTITSPADRGKRGHQQQPPSPPSTTSPRLAIRAPVSSCDSSSSGCLNVQAGQPFLPASTVRTRPSLRIRVTPNSVTAVNAAVQGGSSTNQGPAVREQQRQRHHTVSIMQAYSPDKQIATAGIPYPSHHLISSCSSGSWPTHGYPTLIGPEPSPRPVLSPPDQSAPIVEQPIEGGLFRIIALLIHGEPSWQSRLTGQHISWEVAGLNLPNVD